jgi:hypothetical protein
MAELADAPGDLTSCSRNQLVEPATCATPPDVVCAGAIEACAARGCSIAGSGIVLYADHTYRSGEELGAWSTTFAYGFEVLRLGDQGLRVDTTPQLEIPGCE